MHAHDVPSPGALTAQAHVVVVGGGIAGMVAALECAKIGMRVTLLEASTALGGTIHAAEIAGHVIDVGAQGFSVRGEAVLELVAELGLGADVCSPAAGTAWVAGLPGGAAAPLPAGGVLGIPGNPFVTDVTRVIGVPTSTAFGPCSPSGANTAWARSYARAWGPGCSIGSSRPSRAAPSA